MANFNEELSNKSCLQQQNVPFDVSGAEHVKANPKMTDGPIWYIDEDVQTTFDIFQRGLKVSNNGPCLGWRPQPNASYHWITYQQVLDRSQAFGSGLIALGANPSSDQFIGLFSQNRVEWKLTEQACNNYSMVLVPLYDTLGASSIDFIINQCKLKTIVVDTLKKVDVLLRGVMEKRIVVDHVICMSKLDDEVLKQADNCNVVLKEFNEIEELGKSNLKDFMPPKPEMLHTICYTSGTTGNPKGVMLTHKNLLSNVSGVYCIGKKDFLAVDCTDVHISYLPLAHVFERLLQCVIYYVGARVGFYQGDVQLLVNDAAMLRPTIFPMVPRLINRLYDKINAAFSQSFIKKFLSTRALNAKMHLLQQGIVTTNSIWDKLVFRKVQNMLGGRVRLCFTGAAPISIDVLNFMRCVLGVCFTEGYGQTESTCAISATLPGDYFSGSVGTPALCNLVKLVDVPEKNYFASEGKGEICAKGHNIFQGYYNDPEKTREVLDEDGWLHTGDIGMWLPNGALKVIDRKKHIFKLAQGEYIAPEKIEGVLVQSQPVSQAFIYGESLKSSVIGIIVPDPDTFENWCRSKGVVATYKDLCKSSKANSLLLEEITNLGKQRGLFGFELPKKIHLSPEQFSVENDLLTPTFKAKRAQIVKHYENELQTLYENLD